MLRPFHEIADDARREPFSLAVAHAERSSRRREERGGDFFIYERLPGGRLTLAMGDASSKAVEGRRHARILKHAFRTTVTRCSRPSRIMRQLAASFQKANREVVAAGMFVAVFVATIDPCARVLTYAAAGVEGGLLFRGPSEHEHLTRSGPPLGIEPRPSYDDVTLPFGPDSVLVAYTDGVTEARSVVDGRPLGSGGVAHGVQRLMRTSRGAICAGLWAEIDRLTGGSYRDDATLALVTAFASGAAHPLGRHSFSAGNLSVRRQARSAGQSFSPRE